MQALGSFQRLSPENDHFVSERKGAGFQLRDAGVPSWEEARAVELGALPRDMLPAGQLAAQLSPTWLQAHSFVSQQSLIAPSSLQKSMCPSRAGEGLDSFLRS